MNIEDWPMNEIMQLPDEVFGRRWPYSMSDLDFDIIKSYTIHETKLPEWIVVWECYLVVTREIPSTADMSLALGMNLPTSDAEFEELEKLFPYWYGSTAGRGWVTVPGTAPVRMEKGKVLIHSAGRRLILGCQRVVGTATGSIVTLTLSGVPKDLPRWLKSGPVNNQ